MIDRVPTEENLWSWPIKHKMDDYKQSVTYSWWPNILYSLCPYTDNIVRGGVMFKMRPWDIVYLSYLRFNKFLKQMSFEWNLKSRRKKPQHRNGTNQKPCSFIASSIVHWATLFSLTLLGCRTRNLLYLLTNKWNLENPNV